MNKKFLTPIDKQVLKIMESRERFTLMVVFNDLVKELKETDKTIEEMPEGSEKEYMKKAQEEAWALLLSKNMCDSIIYEA